MDADAHEQGLEQELDACLITDFCSPFFIHIVSKKNINLFLFLSSCTGVKEELHHKKKKKSLRHEDSPVLFYHFSAPFLYFF